MLLSVALRARGLHVADPVILARTGWTTDELMAGIEQASLTGAYDLVTLQIGVNNQYRGRDLGEYRLQFRLLLERAIALAGGDPRRVIVLSIPDWGVTPFAADQDAGQIASEIDRFNSANRLETAQAGAHYVDVTPDSRLAGDNAALLAGDGLHPSGEMYARWVCLVLPLALELFSQG